MKRLLGLALVMSILALGACGDDDDGGTTADAAPQADAGPQVDAGAQAACAANFAGCTTFEDHTADTDPVAITAGVGGDVYAPKCIKITTVQMVTIQASGTHPLTVAACSPSDFASGIQRGTGTYTPGEIGIFGFHCVNHGSELGTGMSGAIQVVAP
jgi:hypothetical protein